MKERIAERKSTDGYPLKYRSWQSGSSNTLIVTLHGLLTHSGWFGGLGDALLERGFHVIGHDRRGSGLNARDRGDAEGPQQLIDDLTCVVEPFRASYEAIVYLGWCLGSMVAMQCLLEKPYLGEGLILMSPDIYECHLNDEVRRVFADPKWDSRVLPRLTVPIPLEIYTDTPYLDGFVRKDDLKLKNFTPRLMRASMQLKSNLEASFKAFRKPSLLVLATRDKIIDNRKTEALYRQIGSESREVVMLECNHGIMFEQPGLLADTVERFSSTLLRQKCA